MMLRWRLWLGLLMLLVGFGLREHAHALATQDRVIETARRLTTIKPDGLPACVYDCSYNPSGDAAILGWVSMGLMVVGVSLLVWSSVMRSKA